MNPSSNNLRQVGRKQNSEYIAASYIHTNLIRDILVLICIKEQKLCTFSLIRE